jgi:hypothetical protein
LGKKVDETHDRIERDILAQTVRFDNFFGSVKGENLRQVRYDLHWRNSVRVEHGGDLNFGTTVRASFALSRISERLRLFIAREGEPATTVPSLPADPGNPGFDRTTPTAHFTNTELRYEVVRTPSVNFFLGAGVRVAVPFEAFVRNRVDYTRHLGDISLLRVGETFFVKNTDLLGETTEFSLERLLARGTVLRWANSATASQEIEGLEWGSELSLFRELSPRSAVTLTGGTYGNTTSSALVNNYRVLVRYRRNFLRKWLFYELEPEVSWPRNPDGSRPANLAVTFRLEIVFQGETVRREEAPPTAPTAAPPHIAP